MAASQLAAAWTEQKRVLLFQLETGWKPWRHFDQNALVLFKVRIVTGQEHILFLPHLISGVIVICKRLISWCHWKSQNGSVWSWFLASSGQLFSIQGSQAIVIVEVFHSRGHVYVKGFEWQFSGAFVRGLLWPVPIWRSDDPSRPVLLLLSSTASLSGRPPLSLVSCLFLVSPMQALPQLQGIPYTTLGHFSTGKGSLTLDSTEQICST